MAARAVVKYGRTVAVALTSSFVGVAALAIFWALIFRGTAVFRSEVVARLVENLVAVSFSIPIAIHVSHSPKWSPVPRRIVVTLVGYGSVVIAVASFIAQVTSDPRVFWPSIVIASVAAVLWIGGFWFCVVASMLKAFRGSREAQSQPSG